MNLYTGVPITLNRCYLFPNIKPTTWCFINSVSGAAEYTLNNINKHVKPLPPDKALEVYTKEIAGEHLRTIKLFKMSLLLQRIYVYLGDKFGGGRIYNIEPISYNNLISVEAGGAKWNNINGQRTNEIVQHYFKEGYDIVRINNVMDTWDGSINNLMVIKEGVDRIIKDVIFNREVDEIVKSIPWIKELDYLFNYE